MVRHGSAKAAFVGSIPTLASISSSLSRWLLRILQLESSPRSAPREISTASQALFQPVEWAKARWLDHLDNVFDKGKLSFGQRNYSKCLMSEKIKKQFGVWMNTHQATIVGHNPAATDFIVLGHARNPGPGSNSNENTSNNHEKTLVRKFFKEIGLHLENADEVHITGTGTIQEEFKHFLEETPQFKRAVVSESTSNEMTDPKLIEFVGGHFK